MISRWRGLEADDVVLSVLLEHAVKARQIPSMSRSLVTYAS